LSKLLPLPEPRHLSPYMKIRAADLSPKAMPCSSGLGHGEVGSEDRGCLRIRVQRWLRAEVSSFPEVLSPHPASSHSAGTPTWVTHLCPHTGTPTPWRMAATLRSIRRWTASL
jgi:hypothetical protein